ncbi:MAG: diacylglycerol/lipid kinase family protein [Lachnospiraceae bacterium]
MIHIFIVNPYAGQKTFADDLRLKLKSIENLNYFVFNIRRAGDEKNLVKRVLHIFQDEKLRFYCCGGSGTMRNMLEGFDDLEKAEVAFFPCGLTNDFLKVFGENESRFHRIEELIEGDVIEVDYIKTNHGVALNTFSVGMDSKNVEGFETYRISSAFGEQVPYYLALLYSVFFSKNVDYEVYLDDEKVEGRFAEVFWGNGYVLGGNLFLAEKACVTDGKAAYLIVPDQRGIKLLQTILIAQKNDFNRLKNRVYCGMSRNIRIRRKDGQPFMMNLDGELISGSEEWTARIVRKGLHLVVPKGVSL